MDSTVATRIHNAVQEFSESGRGDVRRLRGYEREWRLRVGDWRVRFTLDYENRTIQVLRYSVEARHTVNERLTFLNFSQTRAAIVTPTGIPFMRFPRI
ncbi:MAG: type II toxin-antitoxin system RelE/ParE family toxin [Chloroflexi bacterium]|nr:type II toxin-antitoxin system RelE/ParE family toxin [Chloroflexota bacterium]